jgi:hypothetical protein
VFLNQRNIEGFYPDSSLDDAVNKFATLSRQDFAKTSGFDRLAVYSNVSKNEKTGNLKL